MKPSTFSPVGQILRLGPSHAKLTTLCFASLTQLGRPKPAELGSTFHKVQTRVWPSNHTELGSSHFRVELHFTRPTWYERTRPQRQPNKSQKVSRRRPTALQIKLSRHACDELRNCKFPRRIPNMICRSEPWTHKQAVV